MSPENLKRRSHEIPTGKAREMNEAFWDWLVLFEKVKNKVVFVNEEVYAPFKLEKGEESPLGLFAKSVIPRLFQRKPGEQRLETWPRHERSAVLVRSILGDKQGRRYRDTSIKGSGYVEAGTIKLPGQPRFYDGFLDMEKAHEEHLMREEFIKEGIRTARTLAIIDLEEIIYDGKKISVEEARKKGIIKEGFHPAVEVSAFGTKARIADIVYGAEWEEQTKKLVFEDAKELVGQELGRGNNFLNDQEYLQWFAETLGQNVGLMHKKGWFHSNLGPHNITLDCRVVDLHTVKKLDGSEKRRKKDLGDAEASLRRLISQIGFTERADEFLNQFRESYEKHFYGTVGVDNK